MIEVSHISSVHHHNDSRIVKRMVTSLLSQKTFKVKWIAQQASLSDLPGDVCIDLPKVKGKVRITPIAIVKPGIAPANSPANVPMAIKPNVKGSSNTDAPA